MYGVSQSGLGGGTYLSKSAPYAHKAFLPKVLEFKIEYFKSDRDVLDGVCHQLLSSIKSVCIQQPLLEEMFGQVSIDPIQSRA